MSLSLRYIHVSPPYHYSCKGTTRLPGAGQIVREEGKYFGRNPALAREPSKAIQHEVAAAKRSTGQFNYEDLRKPKIPDKRDRPVMGIKTNKNFITANAVEAILQVPKVIENGELNYMKKEDFGRSPPILMK
jgi:hypothetical protein